MNRRRRLLALICASALFVAACGGDDDSSDDETSALEGPISTRAPDTTEAPDADDEDTPVPTTEGPWAVSTEPLANAAGPPRLVVSDGGSIHRIDRGVAVEVVDADRSIGTGLGDGSGLVVYEELEPDDDGIEVGVRLVRLDADGSTSAIRLAQHRSVQLHDLVTVDGQPAVIYALFNDPGDVDTDVTGQVILHMLDTGETTTLAPASGPEFFVSHVSAAAELLALSSTADLTEAVEFRDFAGQAIDRPSPTDDLDYNQPPFISSAVLSPNGSEIATVEGPDVDGSTTDGETLVGNWQVVIDDSDGEQLRITVADQSIVTVTMDFDGRWLVVSGEDADGPVAPLLIDTEATDLAMYLVDAVVGEANLESAAGR